MQSGEGKKKKAVKRPVRLFFDYAKGKYYYKFKGKKTYVQSNLDQAGLLKYVIANVHRKTKRKSSKYPLPPMKGAYYTKEKNKRKRRVASAFNSIKRAKPTKSTTQAPIDLASSASADRELINSILSGQAMAAAIQAQKPVEGFFSLKKTASTAEPTKPEAKDAAVEKPTLKAEPKEPSEVSRSPLDTKSRGYTLSDDNLEKYIPQLEDYLQKREQAAKAGEKFDTSIQDMAGHKEPTEEDKKNAISAAEELAANNAKLAESRALLEKQIMGQIMSTAANRPSAGFATQQIFSDLHNYKQPSGAVLRELYDKKSDVKFNALADQLQRDVMTRLSALDINVINAKDPKMKGKLIDIIEEEAAKYLPPDEPVSAAAPGESAKPKEGKQPDAPESVETEDDVKIKAAIAKLEKDIETLEKQKANVKKPETKAKKDAKIAELKEKLRKLREPSQIGSGKFRKKEHQYVESEPVDFASVPTYTRDELVPGWNSQSMPSPDAPEQVGSGKHFYAPILANGRAFPLDLFIARKKGQSGGGPSKDKPCDCEKSKPGQGLTSCEITDIMEKYPQFGGVYAIDEVGQAPFSLDDNVGVVVNLDKHYEPGSHWCALYWDNDSQSIMWYDSYGEQAPPELMKEIQNVMEKLKPEVYYKWKSNSIKQQRANSDSCGFFATRWLIDMFSGKGWKESTLYDKVGGQVIKSERAIDKFKRGYGYI